MGKTSFVYRPMFGFGMSQKEKTAPDTPPSDNAELINQLRASLAALEARNKELEAREAERKAKTRERVAKSRAKS